jgi:multiple sugar transport system ATP-binding protein
MAVDHLDLEVIDKEFLVLVGPSGCGKSTTLRMIAGLEDVSSGEIRIGGRRVNEVPPKDRNIAMVFQNYALYPHMSVSKNMGFGLELRYGTGWLRRVLWRVISPRRAVELSARRRRIAEEVLRAARILGIEHLLERMPRQLSGGERQRVALGRALVREPAAFLFDEPLSNLDAQLRVEMRREIKDLHRRLATTMVYVTHDQVEALTLGERIVVMNQGVVQQIGTPMEVYDEPKNRFVAGFIGTPPMNFIEGVCQRVGDENGLGIDAVPKHNFVLKHSDANLPLGPELAIRIERAGLKRCVLGIRPEDVHLERPHEPVRGVADDRVELAGVVDMVEPLGDATLVTVYYAGGGRCETTGPGGTLNREPHETDRFCVVSKIEPRATWQAGEPVKAVFPAQRVHLFDAQTGKNRGLENR